MKKHVSVSTFHKFNSHFSLMSSRITASPQRLCSLHYVLHHIPADKLFFTWGTKYNLNMYSYTMFKLLFTAVGSNIVDEVMLMKLMAL